MDKRTLLYTILLYSLFLPPQNQILLVHIPYSFFNHAPWEKVLFLRLNPNTFHSLFIMLLACRANYMLLAWPSSPLYSLLLRPKPTFLHLKGAVCFIPYSHVTPRTAVVLLRSRCSSMALPLCKVIAVFLFALHSAVLPLALQLHRAIQHAHEHSIALLCAHIYPCIYPHRTNFTMSLATTPAFYQRTWPKIACGLNQRARPIPVPPVELSYRGLCLFHWHNDGHFYISISKW